MSDVSVVMDRGAAEDAPAMQHATIAINIWQRFM
jgi:hypothetical protein